MIAASVGKRPAGLPADGRRAVMRWRRCLPFVPLIAAAVAFVAADDCKDTHPDTACVNFVPIPNGAEQTCSGGGGGGSGGGPTAVPTATNTPIPQPPAPPAATTSRYVATTDYGTMYNLGCAQGARGEYGLAVLSFGRPEMSMGVFGVRLHDNNATFASLAEVEASSKWFTVGLYNCSPVPLVAPIRVALGTSNLDAGGVDFFAHGAAWARMVLNVSSFVLTNRYARISVAGGNDFEADWSLPGVAADWADGYMSVGGVKPYYDYGDAGGCPLYSPASPADSPLDNPCNNGWYQSDIRYVAWEVPAANPLPEIYLEDGGNARQWQRVSLYSVFATGSRIIVRGAMSQRTACQERPPCAGTANSPDNAWYQMYVALNTDSRTAELPSDLPYLTDISWYRDLQ